MYKYFQNAKKVIDKSAKKMYNPSKLNLNLIYLFLVVSFLLFYTFIISVGNLCWGSVFLCFFCESYGNFGQNMLYYFSQH